MARSVTETRALDFLKENPTPHAWTAEQREQWSEIQDDWHAATGATERLFANEQLALASFAANPISTKSNRVTAPNPLRDDRRTNSRGQKKDSTMGEYSNPRSYNAIHGLNPAELSDGGFKSLGEFFQCVGSGRYDERLNAMQAAAGTSIGSSGGFMVPEAYINDRLSPEPEQEIVFPRARVYPMAFETLHVSGFDNRNNTDGAVYGNFVADWVAEHGEFDDVTPVTRRITLQRRKLGLFTTASNELVSSSDYESILVPAMRSALANFRDYAYLRGDGSGKPLGILNDPAIIEVAKETGQAASTILYANLAKMYARLHPAHVRNAIWLANPTCVPQLMQITIPTGVAGQVVPVLNQNTGSMSMFGLPLLLTSHLPTLGTSGDVVLADLSQYAIGAGRGLVIDKSEHYKFRNDQVVWRGVFRTDGQGMWGSVVTPRNGDTLSWVTKLATRS